MCQPDLYNLTPIMYSRYVSLFKRLVHIQYTVQEIWYISMAGCVMADDDFKVVSTLCLLLFQQNTCLGFGDKEELEGGKWL